MCGSRVDRGKASGPAPLGSGDVFGELGNFGNSIPLESPEAGLEFDGNRGGARCL